MNKLVEFGTIGLILAGCGGAPSNHDMTPCLAPSGARVEVDDTITNTNLIMFGVDRTALVPTLTCVRSMRTIQITDGPLNLSRIRRFSEFAVGKEARDATGITSIITGAWVTPPDLIEVQVICGSIDIDDEGKITINEDPFCPLMTINPQPTPDSIPTPDLTGKVGY